jgi:hypothetical protein
LNENDENDDEAGTFLDNICDNQIYDDILNGDITEDEVLNAIKNLKNGKAAGIDDFVNEYFKYSQSINRNVYIFFFLQPFILFNIDKAVVPMP